MNDGNTAFLAVKMGPHMILESTTTRIAGGLDFTDISGKRQGRKVPQSLKKAR
jgi:hypothetical protein